MATYAQQRKDEQMFNSIDEKAMSALFPRLTADEAAEITAYLASPQIAELLTELASSCECIGGAIYCTCGGCEPLPVEISAPLIPLAVAYANGADPIPSGLG